MRVFFTNKIYLKLIIREKLPNQRDVCVYIYICKYFNILLSASVLFLFCIVMKINKKGRPANIFSSASVSFLNYPREGLPVDALPRLLVDSHSNLHATADGKWDSAWAWDYKCNCSRLTD